MVLGNNRNKHYGTHAYLAAFSQVLALTNRGTFTLANKSIHFSVHVQRKKSK